MTDMLIRDVPDDVIAALDAHAGRLGLSRSEYVRRRLAQDTAMSGSPVSVQDLARFADVFGDLADPDVMAQAWRGRRGCSTSPGWCAWPPAGTPLNGPPGSGAGWCASRPSPAWRSGTRPDQDRT